MSVRVDLLIYMMSHYHSLSDKCIMSHFYSNVVCTVHVYFTDSTTNQNQYQNKNYYHIVDARVNFDEKEKISFTAKLANITRSYHFIPIPCNHPGIMSKGQEIIKQLMSPYPGFANKREQFK